MGDRRRMNKLIAKLRGYEGLYVLERHFSRAMQSRLVKRVDSRRLEGVLSALLEQHKYRLKYEDMAACLAEENERHFWDDCELFCLNDVLALLVLRKLSSTAKPMDEQVLLENCVRTLQMTEVYDFEQLYEELSAVNRVLFEGQVNEYHRCDVRSRASMRADVYKYARQHKITQVEAAHLYCKQFPAKKKVRGAVYFCAAYGLTAALFALSWYVAGIVAAILLLIPLSEVSKITVRAVMARIVVSKPILKLFPGPIPREAATLVVVTTVLFGKTDVDALVGRLEQFYYQNRDENARFGVLADLPESKMYHSAEDDEVVEYACACVELLNARFGDKFCLFVRARTQSEGGKYIGWERKRGAVIELVRLTRGISGSFSAVLCDDEFLRSVKYILTLDSDTNLYIGAVRELVTTMLHPNNKPVVRDGVVVSGYGVLQPKMATSLTSAAESLFSVMSVGTGGVDSYQSATFDTYQTLFGEGIFCGKGIFDVDVFAEVIDGAFVEGKILSHDLLEGTRLRCGYMSDITLTDSCPKNAISYFARQHRWLRGDMQSVGYARRRVRGEDGKKVRNPISALKRYMILDNVRRALLPVLAMGSILWAYVANYAVWFTILMATGWIILPFVLSVFGSIRHVNRKFYSTVMSRVWHCFCSMVYQVVTLLHNALVSLDAVLRSMWRVHISKRRLLQWTTAAESDAKTSSTILLYFRKMFLSLAIGGLMVAFAPHGIFKAFGVLFLLAPFVSFCLSKKLHDGQKYSSDRKATLTAWSRDMWGFYAEFVTAEENFLPPDNYQELPVETVAHRTSPTNIAMYMLSCLAAADFGFIGASELYERLNATCATIDKMVKYRGQLYNWYDTQTLDVIGVPYISTVDSGNYVTALVTLVQGLGEYAHKQPKLGEIVTTLEQFIEDSDFSFLYNHGRKLFCIGYDVLTEKQSENCYDLLMSEARTTSYFAVAKNLVPKEHWHQLGRPVISNGGHIGLASWSGTAFEYFMPHMLLPLYKNSLVYEGLAFALYEQMAAAHQGAGMERSMWGRSESGYFAFDDEMNYQYKAFGARELALASVPLDDVVVAPYSSFLSMCIAPNMSHANLERMKECGLYGKHGFYEAMDFSPSRVGRGNAIIRSYMAHHVGMSLVAAANATFDNVFSRRFMANAEMNATRELLLERVPADAHISRASRRERLRPEARIKQRRIILPEDLQSSKGGLPQVGLVSNGSTMLMVTSNGDVALSNRLSRAHKIDALTYPFFDGKAELRTMRLLMEVDGEIIDLLRGVDFFCSGTEAKYTYDSGNVKACTRMSVYGHGTAMNIHVSAEGGFRIATPMLAFEPILTDVAAYESHPAFAGLNVVSEYDRDSGVLLFCHRARGKNDRERWMAVSFEGNKSFEFLTRRDQAYPLMYNEEDVRNLVTKKFPGNEGACITPYCAVKKRMTASAGKISCDFLITHGDSREKVLELVTSLRIQRQSGKRERSYPQIFAASVDAISQNQMISSNLSTPEVKYASLVMSRAMYCRNSAKASEDFVGARSDLWKHGVSGDLPIVGFRISDGEKLTDMQKKIVATFARVNRYLARKGFSFDLVLTYDESESYGKPRQRELESLAEAATLGRKGGVHLVNGEGADNLFTSVAVMWAEVDEETILNSLYHELTNDWIAPQRTLTAPSAENLPEVAAPQVEAIVEYEGGKFHRDGFRVLKDGVCVPWSYVYSSAQFGTLVTQNSLGYTWFRNAREFRLTPWSNDALLDFAGEKLICTIDGHEFDLCVQAREVDYSAGCARYYGALPSLRYTVSVGVDGKLPVKLVLCEFENVGTEDMVVELDYRVTPVLGDRARGGICTIHDGRTTFFRNAVESVSGNFEMYVHCGSESSVTIAPGKKMELYYLLGTFNRVHDKCYYHVLERFACARDVRDAFSKYGKKLTTQVSQFALTTNNAALDTMFNHYLLYQGYVIRMLARTGFYQSSGAYGYRDQLQDSLAALYIDSDITKRMIFRCATHQYITGDVQHWWHEVGNLGDKGDRGIKSLCSDDYVWLPFAVARYVEVTQDYDILNVVLPYIDSPPLGEHEHERYELPDVTAHRETLYMHCVRALELAMSRVGNHGLPLIGTCDWNDGMSEVGTEGRGESVWLARFLQLALDGFAVLSDNRGETEDASSFRAASVNFGRAVEEHCYSDGQYLRAFYDNGDPMGASGSSECAIDVLPQAFSVMVGGDNPRNKRAMEKVYERLWDEEHKILRLFDPPFVDGENNPGYIRGYAAGLRENGGQYTHGALWGVLGLFDVGEVERGMEVLNYINPAYRCMDEQVARAYRCEPYALAGDVYSNSEHPGRCGWSLYTGAAAWYYRVVLEKLLGYSERGRHFTIAPKLPMDMDGFELVIRRHGTVYNVKVEKGNVDEVSYTLDGQISSGRFLFDGRVHELKIGLAKKSEIVYNVENKDTSILL